MKNTFKVLFYVKRNAVKKTGEAPIIARITVDQAISQFNTQLEIDPKMWSVSLGKAAGRTTESVRINLLLEDIKMKAQRHYHTLLDIDGYVTAERVRDAYLGKTEKTRTILEFFEQHNEQYLQKVKMDPTNKTYWRYELTRRRLEEFIKYKYSVSDIPLKDINVLFVENFLLFNENVHDCNHNTAMKFVQRLRTVVNFAKNTGMLFVDPFGNFKVKFERTDRGYLTMEEIMAIYHHTFPSRRLEQVRDLFIFSCFTALSYIDVCELQPDDISTGFDGNLWIIRKRHKTKVTASIRLLDIPIAILKKYKGKLPDGKLLPVISNQRVNDYLKEIAAMCGINKKLTFHMARHITLSYSLKTRNLQRLSA